ncbi:MAG: methyltransferase domain-containing protein [Vicinamibacterales bacterium]
MLWDDIPALYERHARAYDHDRGRSLFEQAWLDRLLALVPAGGEVLDVGCGMAEPIARYVIGAGFRVTGIDSAPSLIALCRTRFPDSTWLVGDMRQLDLGCRFDGIVAWDSFFHLHPDDQRAMFPRFAAHAGTDAPLLFTSGTAHGEAIGSYQGEPLYHGSLDRAEYERLLAGHGFRVEAHVENDPDCGGHTVWLTRRCG